MGRLSRLLNIEKEGAILSSAKNSEICCWRQLSLINRVVNLSNTLRVQSYVYLCFCGACVAH